jgi:putative colanic acid biosynthesis UDP-glucose lipid carrier transferase
MSTVPKGLIRPYTSQFSLLSRVLDCLCILLSLAAIRLIDGAALGSDPWVPGLLACVLFFINADFTELYRSWRIESVAKELQQVGTCWLFSFSPVLLGGLMLGEPTALFEWPAFMYWFTLGLLTLGSWRLVLRVALRAARRNGFNTRAVGIAGSGSLAQMVHDKLTNATWSGYVFRGYFDDRFVNEAYEVERRKDTREAIARTSGDFDELVTLAEQGQIDCVYIAMPMYAEKRIAQLADRLSNSAISVYVVPDVFVFDLLHSHTFDIGGLPAISLVGEPHGGLRGVLKRLEDLIGASLILTLISPFMIGIALAVKFTSPGPVIFKQTRYGIDGKPIEVWKFRSMTVMENGDDFVQATRGDRRLTKIGGFLRRTSLDELPQFINVLQGRMSIVGPRPHAVAHNEEFRAKLPRYMRRHRIKPGITGWAQVNGWRGETDTIDKMEKRLEHDLHYINNWSVWWDIKIIARTVLSGFSGRNAF